MVFVYRGFHVIVSEPAPKQPLVCRVYDPMDPTKVAERFEKRRRTIDQMVQLACGYIDVRCDHEADAVLLAATQLA